MKSKRKKLTPTLAFLTLFLVLGCGGDEEPNIPGAPIITIEKAAFEGWEGSDDPRFSYRLKAEEPLPYDIEVRLSVRYTYTVGGWLYGDVDESEELKANKVRSYAVGQ